MTARPIPGRNHLMRLGVRQYVAIEYRRLLAAGVNAETAGVLALSPARYYTRRVRGKLPRSEEAA